MSLSPSRVEMFLVLADGLGTNSSALAPCFLKHMRNVGKRPPPTTASDGHSGPCATPVGQAVAEQRAGQEAAGPSLPAELPVKSPG